MSRIILAEDEQIIRLLMKRWLESHGHTVIDCANVDDTLEVLKQEAAGQIEPIDLLILDIELGNGKHGKFSGKKVLEEVPPRIKRVIVSGHSPEEVRASIDPLVGVQFYFSKPMTEDQKAQLLVMAEVAGWDHES